MSQQLWNEAAPTVCGRALGRARHACAFVSSHEEAVNILTPFATEGIDRGERVLQIVPDGLLESHVDRMRATSSAAGKALESGQLSILEWKEAYLKGGSFDADRMLGMLTDFLADRRARGFPLARGMGTMEWALTGARGVERLMEYEARVSLLSANHPDPLLCTYDTTRFPANTIIDVLRVHPVAIIGGVVYENPFYAPPEDMLREIEARGRR